MSSDAHDVHELYRRLSDQLGPETTELLMSRMPLTPTNELATRTDVELVRTELRSEMADLRSELRGEMADLRTDLRTEMAEMKSELKSDLTRLTVALGIGSPIATATLVAAVMAVA